MSKIKRKITVNLTTKGKGGIAKTRPSVFERLGTKATNTGKEYCHHWAQSGSCPYGKGCKYSNTHTLISPSKQRAAKSQRRHIKDGHKRVQHEEWNQWDPDELEDADPDDLERKRQELQRELELQMHMENKAKKKEKKKKESSPSTETSSSTTDSTSTSEESSSSTSSSAEARRRKLKKPKTKRTSSTSSDERGRSKHKPKIKRSSKSSGRDKSKKGSKIVKTKSASPNRQRKKSETPPIKSKTSSNSKKLSSEKSPRPQSRTSIKEKHRTPSPKPTKDKEREKEREREREREREKEREKEREREREKEKEREREREKERERAKERAKEREREKEKEHKKKELNRSPKRDNRSIKDVRKRDTPDSAHSKDRKISPGRGKGSGRRDHKSPVKDDRRNDRRDDRARSRGKDARSSDRGPTRKDTTKRDSRDRERERERERRLAREREEAREKEREEALARCQERQRERERLKKEEEQRRRDRNRRDDRGLDKPTGDRVERLLPPLEERVPPSRKAHSSERDRDRGRDGRGRDRVSSDRSVSRKSPDRRGGDIDKDRSYDRSYDRARPDHERDYSAAGHRDKEYESPYERGRQHEDRRYLDVEEHYGEGVRDERMYGGALDDRRSRRELWDERGDVDSRDIEHRPRYGARDDLLKNNRGGGDWGDHQHPEYPEHDWDRNGRRPINPEWDARDNWDVDQHKQTSVGSMEEEWRHYNRSMDAWNNDDRRRWPQEWRDRSRPRSAASHNVESMSVPPSEDSNLELNRKKETPVVQQLVVEEPEVKIETPEEEDPNRSTPLSQKRPADEAVDSPGSAKKLCLKQEIIAQVALEDDLSEISDDADDILNRDEDILEALIEDQLLETTEVLESSAAIAVVPAPEQNTSAASHKSQSPPPEQQLPPKSPSANVPNNKGDSVDDDNMELDFEEISEDELEEESKMRGLVDALGVDWSSLIAESKPRTKPTSCAKIKWEAHNILVNLGVSVHLAGENLVREILKEHAEAELEQQKAEANIKSEVTDVKIKKEPEEPIMNGMEVQIKIEKQDEIKMEPLDSEEVHISHPLAAIQVADREKLAIRKSLFTSVGPHRRALAARRDLTIRRHLCNLPITDKHVEAPKRHDPDLFQLATQLFERSL